MRTRLILAFALIALFTIAGLAARRSQSPSPAPTPHIDVQKVADGVYAAIRTEPPGLFFNANSIFLVNDADVIVVDTNITPGSAKESLAALRAITTKPV
ncbi:MAG: hypothetical protein ACHQO8_08990, partial [Vicinamibacterales bacterium]